MADRKLVVQILGDDRSLHNAFSRSSKDAGRWGDTIQRATRGGVVATVGFRGLGRSVAFASGAFLGGAGFVAAAKGAVTAASNLSEQINKTNVLFEKSSAGVQRFAKTTAASLGLSQRAALEAAGGFGAMLETAGLTSAEAAKFSKNLVRLGADMASFNNIDPSEALLKLKSGLAGEAEPLRTVGVLLSETRVKQEAYRLGLAKVGETLTEGQKVQARYALILKDTAKQQGDFGRTSGGLANQQRILAAQVENLQAALGAALLPDILKVVKALNTWLSSSENQVRVQKTVNDSVKAAEAIFGGLVDVLTPLVKAGRDASEALGGLRNTVKLLIAVMVGSKVVAFTGGITGLGREASVATGRVTALRGALLRLGAIGLITVGIEVLLNRKAINEGTKDFLKGLGLGGLAGGATLDIPVNVRIADLEATRDRVAALKGESDLMVKTLDAVIAKLRQVDKQRFNKAEASFEGLRKKIDAIPEKKQVDVQATLQGIDRVQAQLAKVKNKTVAVRVLEQGLAAMETKLAGVKDKTVLVSFLEEGLDAIQGKLDALKFPTITVGGGARSQAGRVKVPSLVGAFDDIIGATNQAIAKLQKAAKTSKVKAKVAFQNLMDSLSRAGTLAGATPDLGDDLRVLRAQLAAVQAEIKVEGRTKDLLDQQADLTAQITTTQRDIAANAQQATVATKAASKAREQAARANADAARKANQFLKLGLTREGQERVPGVAALSKRLTSIREQVKGTVLDTPKTQAELARIAKVLAGKFGKAGRDVRSAILQMFNDIAGALDQGGKKGPLTKTTSLNSKKILEGIGLSPEEIRELRGRLSNFNSAGRGLPGANRTSTSGGFAGGPIVVQSNVTVDVMLDKQKVGSAVTSVQQKDRRRNPKQKRGPHRMTGGV